MVVRSICFNPIVKHRHSGVNPRIQRFPATPAPGSDPNEDIVDGQGTPGISLAGPHAPARGACADHAGSHEVEAGVCGDTIFLVKNGHIRHVELCWNDATGLESKSNTIFVNITEQR